MKKAALGLIAVLGIFLILGGCIGEETTTENHQPGNESEEVPGNESTSNGNVAHSCEEANCSEGEICVEPHEGVFTCIEKEETCIEEGCPKEQSCVEEENSYVCKDTPIQISYSNNVNSYCEESCMINALVTYSHEKGKAPIDSEMCYKREEDEDYQCTDLMNSDENYEEGVGFSGEAGNLAEEGYFEEGENIKFYFRFNDGEHTVVTKKYEYQIVQ